MAELVQPAVSLCALLYQIRAKDLYIELIFLSSRIRITLISVSRAPLHRLLVAISFVFVFVELGAYVAPIKYCTFNPIRIRSLSF